MLVDYSEPLEPLGLLLSLPHIWPATGYWPLGIIRGVFKGNIEIFDIDAGVAGKKIAYSIDFDRRIYLYGLFRDGYFETRIAEAINQLIIEGARLYCDGKGTVP